LFAAATARPKPGYVNGGENSMKRKEKKQYKTPRVRVTYPKARLEQAVRPHGPAPNYGVPIP